MEIRSDCGQRAVLMAELVNAWLEFLETDSVDASAVPRRAKMVTQAEAWMANDMQNVLEEMDAPVDDEFALSMPVSPHQPGGAELVHPSPVLGRDGSAGNPVDGGILPEDAVDDSVVSRQYQPSTMGVSVHC